MWPRPNKGVLTKFLYTRILYAREDRVLIVEELNIELLTATLCSADFASKSFLCHCLGWSIVEMTRCIDRLEIFSRTEKHEHYSDVRTTFVLVPQTLAARQESNVSGKIGDRYDKILTDYLVDPD